MLIEFKVKKKKPNMRDQLHTFHHTLTVYTLNLVLLRLVVSKRKDKNHSTIIIIIKKPFTLSLKENQSKPTRLNRRVGLSSGFLNSSEPDL